MRCDIDEGRIELTQFLNICKQLTGARPLQRGQHLERELMLVGWLVDYLCYGHNTVQRYEKTSEEQKKNQFFFFSSECKYLLDSYLQE